MLNPLPAFIINAQLKLYLLVFVYDQYPLAKSKPQLKSGIVQCDMNCLAFKTGSSHRIICVQFVSKSVVPLSLKGVFVRLCITVLMVSHNTVDSNNLLRLQTGHF